MKAGRLYGLLREEGCVFYAVANAAAVQRLVMPPFYIAVTQYMQSCRVLMVHRCIQWKKWDPIFYLCVDCT